MTMQSPKRKLPPTFIVGSGRSGTTLLMTLFAGHPEIFTPRIETRFLVDPGGLLDIVNNLTVDYSPTRAREALYRFERLMKIDLVNPRARPYVGIKLDRWFGDNYWQALEKYCNSLVEYEFTGIDHPIPGFDSGLVRLARLMESLLQRVQKKWLPPPIGWSRAVIREPRYFSNRDELIGLTRAFMCDLFETATSEANAKFWCEKTPHHLQHLEFIFEIFPEARIIHMLRDPRDVALSFTRQVWAPSDPEDAAKLLKMMYEAWFDKRPKLKLTPENYLEVRLEDLTTMTHQTLETIQAFCGLSFAFESGGIRDQNEISSLSNKYSDEEINLVENILGTYVDRLGY